MSDSDDERRPNFKQGKAFFELNPIECDIYIYKKMSIEKYFKEAYCPFAQMKANRIQINLK